MLRKGTLTVLAILVTNGCAGWHMFPKNAASSTPQQAGVPEQPEVAEFKEARASHFRDRANTEYHRAILAKVQENWIPPAETPSNITCNLRVQQFPDGEVISAAVVDSCGSPAIDGSIIDAVYQASPLPKPGDVSIFQQELIFRFSYP
nr:TonB C-terminal domain-containing protein [Gammaproteobacteria bacterium]